MPANYPNSAPSFSTKIDGEAIAASHMNDVQNEIVAIGSALLNGLAHLVQPSTDAARDLGAVAKRWRDLFLSRNATIGGNLAVTGTSTFTGNVTASGDITAATFTGDGSGLTGVVAVSEQGVPPGTIVAYGGAAAPADWLLCDGSAVDRTTYAALFAIIGETYGVGDGSTTFNLPDLRGRFPLGKAASGTGSALAETGGAIDHDHTTSAHTHDVGTLAVASHNHSAGTLAVASHTHSFSDTTSSNGSHSHTVNSHTHSSGTLAVASHTHSISFSSTSFNGGASSGVSSITSPTGSSAPDVTGSTASASPGTDSQGSHTHTVSGTTGSASPALSGNTGSTAPAISGSTASGGGSNTGTNNPPYQVVNYLIKT